MGAASDMDKGEARLMRPKVSIIVPVYNMELHLQKCLDSIFAQRFKETLNKSLNVVK